MKKFKKLIINNFQGHEHTEIEFSPSITTFVGPSDSGKTAIFRDIDYLINHSSKYGQPKHIRRGTKKSVSTLVFEDDSEITKERTKSTTKVTTVAPDGTVNSYKDFGVKVPPLVTEFIGHKPVQIDPELSIDLNFARQLDNAFLIADKENVRAKTLDGLARINVFNRALKNTNLELRRISMEKKEIDDRISTIDTRLEELGDLQSEANQIQQLEQLIENIKKLENRRKELLALQQKDEIIQRDISETNEIIQRLHILGKAELEVSKLMLATRKNDTLTILDVKNTEVGRQLELTKQTIATLKDLPNQETLIKELIQKQQRKSLLEEKEKLLNDVLLETSRAEKIIALKPQLQASDKLLSEIVAVEERKTALENKTIALDKVLNDITICNKAISKKESILKAEMELVQLQQTLITRGKMVELGTSYFSKVAEIDKETSVRNILKDISLSEVMLKQINETIQKKKSLEVLNEQLEQCNTGISKGSEYVLTTKEELRQNKQLYADHLRELKTCPVCHSDLTEEHVHDIIEKL